ncbi:MAG: hypothetical protein M3R45_10870 [Pseudomonadota bacterium]|nr:hypothetical protein [Pseudomonadota bacterium]
MPGKAYEELIHKHLGASVIGPIARDATALHARERAQYSAAETATLNAEKADKTPKAPRRRSRPAAGSAKTAKAEPRSRIPAQLL